MRRSATVVSFFALVTGCGQAGQPAVMIPSAAPTQPRYGPSFEWMTSSSGTRSGLAFAIPETDAVGIDMECERGSRTIRLSAVDPSGHGTQLDIGSGEIHMRVGATPTADSNFDDSIYAVSDLPSD